MVANQTSGGPGVYYIPEGGDYYFKFESLGKWSARVVELPQAGKSGPSPGDTAPFVSRSAERDTLPDQVGHCASTTVASVETRLKDTPGSGSAVNFANGGFQVSYDQVPQIEASRTGDRAVMCLVKLPENCPPGDNRGKIYATVNLRTLELWVEPDSSHECGGA